MHSVYSELFVHCVWSTWEREPLIRPSIEPNIYACMAAKCRELKCEPLEIGGTLDHIHLLVSLSLTVDVAKLIGAVKGASSYLAAQHLTPDTFFRWQQGYGVFSASKNQLPALRNYIRNQKTHHQQGILVDGWENWDKAKPVHT